MRKLLLIDDSSTARAIVARVLGDGYELASESSGRAALEAIKKDPPELIILDLLMPDMDGFAVLKELRERKSRIPVLVLSADIQNSTRERVLELGAVGITYKPPRPDTFRKAVEDALSGSGA
jgi:twitching motility two-component system response regulator PilH